MLKEIMAEFQQNERPLCLTELSQKLAVETSALEGMVQILVRKGRLLEIEPTPSGCHLCPIKAGCFLMSESQKSYYLGSKKSG